jgi:hypothetical protein
MGGEKGEKKPQDWEKLKRYGVYFLAVALLLAEIGGTIYLVFTRVPILQEKWAALAAVREEERQIAAAVAVLAGIDEGTLLEDLRRATAALPAEKKTSGLISGLVKLASQSGTLVTGLEFSPGLISTEAGKASPAAMLRKQYESGETVKSNGVKAVTVNAALVANLSALADFLRKLAAVSQMLAVTRVQYNTAGGAAGQTVGLTLLVPFQPLKEKEIDWRLVRALSAEEKKTVTDLPAEDIFLPPQE